MPSKRKTKLSQKDEEAALSTEKDTMLKGKGADEEEDENMNTTAE